jgi:N-acetylneuraminic acid mutarotase
MLCLILFSLILISLSSCGEEAYTEPLNSDVWEHVDDMTEARMASASLKVGDVLYMIGGSNSNGYIDSVEWAGLGADGMPGEWKKTRSLSTPRGYSAAVAYNRHVYVIGGAHGKHGADLLNTVERARINSDGTLGRWKIERERLFSARRGVSAIVSGGYVYAIGGYNGEFLDTVERAKINIDGTLGEWDVVSIMNHRRYIHSAVMVNRVLYVIGGHHRSSGGATNRVEYARIDNDGELGEWVDAPSLKVARYGARAFAGSGFIYLLGGYDGSALDSIERALIMKDGSIGEWTIVSLISIARDAPSVFVFDDIVLVAGGAELSGAALKSIEAARLDSVGRFAPWAR